MRLNRTRCVGFALLFALLLPLRGFAALPACGHAEAAAQAAQHHCGHAPAADHHPNCGDCCGAAAMALTPIRWAAPRPTPPEITLAALGFPPAGILDRLDRPPRLILA